MLCRVFAFSPDLWFVDMYDILVFGLRRLSFWHGGFLCLRLRNKSFLCIGLSMLEGDMILKLKTSHGLAN
jgi:hypothetical protein